jgi:hypothetical protein
VELSVDDDEEANQKYEELKQQYFICKKKESIQETLW